MGRIQLSIKGDSRFTEEIINRYENNDKSGIHKYDIAYPKNKTCSISERNPGINGSKVCKNCYYRAIFQIKWRIFLNRKEKNLSNIKFH